MSIAPLETPEVINRRLIDYFGRFENGEANWKLVWSEDFLEKRLIYATPEGFELLTPIAETRKKADYIENRYILVKLVPVPEVNQATLCGAKTSYEPVWTFEDANRDPIAPVWLSIKYIIDTLNAAVGHGPSMYAKYKQDEKDGNTVEAIKARVESRMKDLFGNETSISDSLALDSAVGYGTRQRKDWLQ